MNLTPEQREIGKQNFHEAVGTTRRDFLKGAVASGAVASGALGAMYFGYGGAVENPVRVGIIGTGDEGGVLIGALNPSPLTQIMSTSWQSPTSDPTASIGRSTATRPTSAPGLG